MKIGFFQESSGNNSIMRLMCFISLLTAICFGLITLLNPQLKDVGIQLTFSFLVSAFAPKTLQKFLYDPRKTQCF